MTAAAAGALAVAGLWLVDSWRRSRQATLLHRDLVDLLLNTLHAGDPHTERHSRRVADLTDALAATYGFSRRRHSRLRVAALLHDMGKIEDQFFEILHSCDPLTPEQRRSVEEHPHESADILRPLERLHPGITPIVEAHHERWDGKGYPHRLQGPRIPLEARIISAADVFDALTQPRTYHGPLSLDEALDEIRRNSGQRFDPGVVRRLELPPVKDRFAQIAARGRAEDHRRNRPRSGRKGRGANTGGSPSSG